MAHAPFAPSGFKRVMLCPGSHQAEKKYQDPPKEYAAEGTFAHDIRDTALKEGLNAEDFVGTYCEVEGFGFFWGMADAHMLQPGIDRIRDVGAEWHFEKRVNMERWIKDCWGTLDAGGILPDLIIIDDLKWGRGVRVSANRNIQMMLYALGFWDQVARHKTKARRFLLRIDQPRIPGGTNEWYTSLDELLAFAQEAIEAAELQEQFLWCTDAECEARIRDRQRRKAIAQELADVVNYALLLADRMELDLPTEIRKKIRINARKYPVRKSKGSAKKYTEL